MKFSDDSKSRERVATIIEFGPILKNKINSSSTDDKTSQGYPEEGLDDKLDLAHEREERTFWHYARLTCLGTLCSVGVLVVLAYTLNLILPPYWRWLDLEDLDNIKTLASSIISGILMSLAIQYFSDKRK